MIRTLIGDRLGCRVSVAHDGDAAVRNLAAEATDVLLADMIMPGLQGLDLVAAVHNGFPDTDIIVMTGHPGDFPYVSVIRTGAKDFLAKPYHPDELEAKLVRLFRERDIRDAQRLAESRYRSAFESNTNGMVFLNEGTGIIADTNGAFCLLSGRPAGDLVGKPLTDFLTPHERGRFEQGLALCVQSGQGTVGDIVLVRPNEEQVSLDITVTVISVAAERSVCLTFKDTTEQRRLEENLVETAQRDALTGLFNKRTFDMSLEDAVARTHHSDKPLSIIFLDLDNFKQCNDTHGHQIGDQVLRTAGQLIQKNIRAASDKGFRYGGDEFAVILGDARAETARRIAERIQKGLEEAENFGVSLSIGIARYNDTMSPAALARTADEALYRAKSLGKNVICVA